MYNIGFFDSICVRSRPSVTNSLPSNSTFQIFCGVAFVDDEHDALVGRLVAFEDRDLRVVEAVAAVEVDDLAAGFLDGIRIDRAADLEAGLLGQLLVADAARPRNSTSLPRYSM